ncbi:MAG: glycerophosphodiester phosphodiesterase family protein [Candidatus Thalassarchaeaceae archaeon]|jgi:glycerophosphoryl diester phosphodiesterase|nr:glycerophosphodiester phosphodiesterase family protein [Candidatus Thalassarchaeaceae archaeon]
MAEEWVKPTENSIEAIRHGISHMDGVEFDLRLTMDNQLILFHDNHLSREHRKIIGGSKWTEDHTADELAELGIDTFEKLLSDNVFATAWREHAKMACVELKMPHPKSKVAGSVSPKKRERHASKMAKMTDEMLSEVGLEQSNVVFISFKRKFRRSCARANVRWPVAQLQPAIPEMGGKWMKKILALPSFMWLSLAYHLKRQQMVGAPMLPCGLEYIDGFTRHFTLGRTFGTSGYTGRRLTRLRKGFQAFVWPSPLRVERALQELGLAGICDEVSPELVTLPDGGARWTRWSSQPLDDERAALLRNSDPSDHSAIIEESAREVTPWYELTDIERRGFLSIWRKKWQWERDIDELAEDASPNKMPWEVSRLIGHRGAGID